MVAEIRGRTRSAAGDWSPGTPPAAVGPRLPFYVVLDNIRSVYNVGSIFRTSDALRLSHLYLCGMTAYPPHPKLDKTALGAAGHVPWSHAADAVSVVRDLQERGIPIWACETGPGADDYLGAEFPAPAAFVFGHEVAGVSPAVLELAERRIAIPMGGFKASLNVATAYGVILFEGMRQLRQKGIWSPPGKG
ncbi:MAG: TrmH family RNA methyltransferase [Candidatus Eisenbacteria bacterium]|nr:TrmH family RNA methyltransferase [Candidatus Eisenbacteria bacterium]